MVKYAAMSQRFRPVPHSVLLFLALTLTTVATALADPPASALATLPPPRTPEALLKPTPAPTEAEQELEQFRLFLPKAFYDSPTFPERYKSVVELEARDEYEGEEGYHFDKIIRGGRREKRIALTFDDGPHATYTLELLKVLKREHVQATFFVVGKQVNKFPTLVQLEVIEGHEVGNHTY